MTIKELHEQRTKLLKDAQAILLANPDNEKRASANKMIADADVLEADIKSLQKIETVVEEERSRTTPNRPNPGEDVVNNKIEVEKRAFSDFIRYGKATGLQSQENRELTTS